jgi:carbon storage regulator CsrA
VGGFFIERNKMDNKPPIQPGLVLTRRLGESFVCFAGEEEIEVIVAEISDKRTVRLRIVAPKSVDIERSENLEWYDEK